ncbi:MAG: hypothetical protein ABI543_12975 [Ignavibacteria bacterium]
MRTFGLAVVLSFFLISFANAQSANENLAERFYLTGGYQHSFHSYAGFVLKDGGFRQSRSFEAEGWFDNFQGGIGFKMNNKFSLEVMYEYTGEIGYSDKQFKQSIPEPPWNFYSYMFTDFSSHELTFRGIIFVNDDRTDDPVYFVSGLSFSYQPVENRFIDEYKDRVVTVENSYKRVAAGPVAGVGVFWDLGYISFTTEFTFSAKASVFKPGLSETSMKLSISPVFKF